MPHKPLLYMFSRDQDSIDYSTNMENYSIDYMAMFCLQHIIVLLPDTLQATQQRPWGVCEPWCGRNHWSHGQVANAASGDLKNRWATKKRWLFRLYTPPKFNIAPEKWWLEDEFPFGIAYF